jgi:hypothetical protein
VARAGGACCRGPVVCVSRNCRSVPTDELVTWSGFPGRGAKPLTGRRHRQSLGACLPAFQHTHARFLRGGTRGGAGPFWSARDLQHGQGAQFTSGAWIDVLKGGGVRISMDGKGRWVDNVFIERLWRFCEVRERLPACLSVGPNLTSASAIDFSRPAACDWSPVLRVAERRKLVGSENDDARSRVCSERGDRFYIAIWH